MIQNFKFSQLFILLLLVGCSSCGSDAPSGDSGETDSASVSDGINKVIYHVLSDPKALNPFNTSDSEVTNLCYHVYQPLVSLDFETYDIIPVLAKKRAVIETTPEEKVTMTFEIRDEAKFDDGKEILAKDIAFSLKVVKTPKTDCKHLKPYFEYIEDIKFYEDNPRKLTIICKEPYMAIESALSDLHILPASVYDPEGLLEGFTVKQLSDGGKAIESDETLNNFAEFFNSSKFQREVMVGSGPYRFVKWETNQRVILEKKKDWWANGLDAENKIFANYPDQIVYETINDQTTALVALKGEKINHMRSIVARDFVKDLQQSEAVKSKFHLHTPPTFIYGYIGLNMRSPKLQDVRTRKALAHMMDVEKYLNTVSYGLAVRVNGPTHPNLTKIHNANIPLVDVSIEKAKGLLSDAGWSDSDGDGLLDKEIDDEITQFEIEIMVPQGSKNSQSASLIFQEELRKIGIKLNINTIDWSVQLERCKKHEFEMYMAAWVSSPSGGDPKQIWHTDSYNSGSNYVGFGDEKSDALIEKIRRTMDDDERAILQKELQEVIVAAQPYIFLSSSKNRIAIHKKFQGTQLSGISPGMWMASSKMLESVPN